MTVGTKSLLFGVHQFLIHPIVVALAWRAYHGHWPQDKAEWVAIVVHDFGYWGCRDMDGEIGVNHPLRGAEIAWEILKSDPVARRKARDLCLGHSRHFSRQRRQPVSDLYAPDKLSVLFESRWFYLVRAVASGEVWEYIVNSRTDFTPREWLEWYRGHVYQKFFT